MYSELKSKSAWVRLQVLSSVEKAKKGHLGGTFSCVDLLVALYYANILNITAQNVNMMDRNKFLLGKGHACLALFIILVDLGIMDPDLLEQYGSNSRIIGGQLDNRIPGTDINTGSLGHAIGIAAGMAYSARLDGLPFKSYAMVGDGECDEGSIWESVMFASRNGLDNLVAIVDRNRQSVTEIIEDDDGSGSMEAKFLACGWNVITIDGHDFNSIMPALNALRQQTLPTVLIADTVKGKGVSFMEAGIKWHHSVPTVEEFNLAKKELGELITS